MTNIGLIDVDRKGFPNLALMKIAAYHRSLGDNVEWVEPMYWDYDRVYQSKVFTFTPDTNRVFSCEVVKGGTGYDIHSVLPGEIDRLQPDYSIYHDIDSKTAYGFLTRGCPNKCKWCIVPLKEGDVILQQGYSGKRPMLVRFEHGAFVTGEHSGSSTSIRPMLIQKRCEVLGNIYDNPSLISDNQ